MTDLENNNEIADGACFDPVVFLDGEQKEQDEKYYPNGVKRPKYRNRREKVSNCRRPIGWYIAADGTPKLLREPPCHVITGDDPCEYCLKVRNYNRKKSVERRIDDVSNRQLYAINIENGVESNRLKANCHNHNYEYLLVPIDSSGTKVAIVDGPVKGSFPVSNERAKHLVRQTSTFISPDRKLRISGKLGLSEYSDAIPGHANSVNVETHIIGFYGKNKPAEIDIVRAYILAMIQTSGKTELTRENIQDVFDERHKRAMLYLEEMGFSPYVKFTKVDAIDFDIVKDRWTEVVLQLPRVTGHIESLDGLTRLVLSMSLKQMKEIMGSDKKIIENIVKSSAE